MNTILPVTLNNDATKLILLDQTKLPTMETFLEIDTKEDLFEAIMKLRVRGAPAIGVAAAYGLYICMQKKVYGCVDEMMKDFRTLKSYLASSRPTAVNLFWALNRMELRFLNECKQESCSSESVLKGLFEESAAIFHEDQNMSIAIGKHGLTLLEKNMGIMTHCNAGGLATTGYGTALAPLYLGFEQGYGFKVFSNETRPLLQGSRLTAYELHKVGIDVTVLCDSMASLVMKQGKIDAIIVGADRIAANGDTANKIGTSGLAIMAKEFGIPFYVAAPTSTFDLQTAVGDDIEIEVRDGEEVTNGFGRRTGPEGIKVYNPAFDVTPSKHITAIITERGIISHPDAESVAIHLENC
ncbi:MAG: S-methyl-5-thioribose-1-phosphate isomerase [Sphaerochaeta sp.]|nr:S-methyl-5-thioribose-1-phosphate isomerase [Sphaerochaeta sp.]